MTGVTDGALTCARYAFPPNLLHYCGPQKQNDLTGYIKSNANDRGLVEILSRFDTLYSYLLLIASENKIKNPFANRVVEAYWLGNELLSRVRYSAYMDHLVDGLGMKKKLKTSQLQLMKSQIEVSMPYHTYHVLAMYKRTGHLPIAHTLETMDECRISWGRIVSSGQMAVGRTKNKFIVETRPLIAVKNKLTLGKAVKKAVTCSDLHYRENDWVSLHWGTVCAKLSENQVRQLSRFTQHSLSLVNKTIHFANEFAKV